MLCLHIEILHSNVDKWSMTKENIEESHMHNTEQKKQDTEQYILYDIFHIKFKDTENWFIVREVIILWELVTRKGN